MSTSIRKATNADFPALQFVKPQLDQATFSKRIEAQQKGDVEYLVVEADGELVAQVLLKWHGKPTYPNYPDLEDLYTKDTARGKGYASMLINECECKVKEKGFSKIGMAANVDPRCPARKLYAKLGYVHDGKEQYVDGVYDGVKDWVVDLEKGL